VVREDSIPLQTLSIKVVRALQNSSKTFLNNLAQELKIANAAQHAKVTPTKKIEDMVVKKKTSVRKVFRAINYHPQGCEGGVRGGGEQYLWHVRHFFKRIFISWFAFLLLLPAP